MSDPMDAMKRQDPIDASRLRDHLRRVLPSLTKQLTGITSERRAGVLLIFYPKNGEAHILFTKRSQEVAEHKGEISFPGGAYDTQDKTILQTALRESREELGLNVNEFEILGELDDVYVPPTRFLITPFVAFMNQPPKPKPSLLEISEVLEIPASELLNPSIFREEVREAAGMKRQLQFYSYGQYVIWGATARILRQFLDLVSTMGSKSH